MTYLISALALVAIFAIATTKPVNMGLLGFGAAFAVGGWVSGISIEEIESFFPADLFVIVVGLTLLFGIAKVNGTTDVIMDSALRLVRGKPWAIVWLMFFIASGLMALGSPMAVAMLAPIAMPLAKRYAIDPLLMAMMISHGALAAAFSPISVYALGVDKIVGEQGIDVPPLILFIVPFALNLVLAGALFLARGRNLMRSVGPDGGAAGGVTKDRAYGTGDPASGGRDVADDGPRPVGGGTAVARRTSSGVAHVVDSVAVVTRERVVLTWEHGLTFAALAALIVAAVMGVDAGVMAMCLSAILLLLTPHRAQAALGSISWAATLLVCGVVTYMGVLTANGTLGFVGQKATDIPWPLLTALVLFVAVGVISAVGSSIGIILIALPLAMPLLAEGQLGAVGFIVALSFCATVVDVSPFSTNGAIVLTCAEVDDRRKFQRRMLGYCGYILVVAPLLAWATVVIPTSR